MLKLARTVLVLSILLLITSNSVLFQNVHAQTVSTLYTSPSRVQNPGSAFTLGVRLTLAADEVINAFDVTLNYTNHPSVLNAGQSIGTVGNIFSGSTSPASPVGQCVDGVTNSSSLTCTVGQVRFAEVILGGTVPSGDYLLFTVTFNAAVSGSSVFTLSGTLVNPVDSAGVVNAHLIPFVAKGGAFANSGTVAFFNFWPLNGPSALIGQPVTFDASPSFSVGASIANYTWNFNDGSPVETMSSSQFSHKFNSTGQYPVQLTVKDTKGGNNSITRAVLVVPALGNLQLSLKPSKQGARLGTVTVQIFNATPSPSPTFWGERASDAAGGVLLRDFSPGSYFLKFSGPNIEDYSKYETVVAGWTTTDTVNLTVKNPATDNSGIVYLGSMAAALAVVFGVIVVRRSSNYRNRRRKIQPRGPREALKRTVKRLSSA